MKSQPQQTQSMSKVWLNYYQIEQTSKSDLLHKEISCSKQSAINILTHPYSSIGLLKYSNSSRGVNLNGTAFLIDSDLIVTTADNVYSKQDECFFKDFYFYPPTFDKNEPPIKIREFRMDQNYIKTETHGQLVSVSLALMKLDRPVYRPRYCEIKYNYSHEEGLVSMYGYPKPINGQRLFGRSGKVVKIQQNLIVHSILSEPGQAGSPIFAKINDRWQTIGVHFNNSNHYGIGLLFTKQLIVQLCRWQRQMMVSNIKISRYNQEQNQTANEIFKFSFDTQSVQLSQIMKNWTPISVEWEANPDSTSKLDIDRNTITRKQIGYFDNRHTQATTVHPLPKEGKFAIKAKIVKYGNSAPYDSVYFGLITQKHKKNKYSDGRHRGSVAYLSYPDNYKGDGTGRGTILMDGKQMAYGEDLFLREGEEVKIEINLFSSELTFTNKRRSVTMKAGAHFGNKNLYLFTSICSHNSCVSWHSVDGPVWS